MPNQLPVCHALFVHHMVQPLYKGHIAVFAQEDGAHFAVFLNEVEQILQEGECMAEHHVILVGNNDLVELAEQIFLDLGEHIKDVPII